MKKIVHGTFNGTGAALYIGIGFIPDWVKIYNLEDADVAMLEWNINMMRSLEMSSGRLNYTAAGLVGDPRTVSDLGVVPYEGGEAIAAASTAYLKPIEDKYRNQKFNQSTGLAITAWTLDTSANRTGHVNAGLDTTYVGEGSLIQIDGKWYGVHAITNDGDATDELTLSRAAASGVVGFVSPMYDYIGCVAGDITKAGFGLTATDVINVSGELCCFEAGMYSD